MAAPSISSWNLSITSNNLCVPADRLRRFEHVIDREIAKGHSRSQRQTGLITRAEFNLGRGIDLALRFFLWFLPNYVSFNRRRGLFAGDAQRADGAITAPTHSG